MTEVLAVVKESGRREEVQDLAEAMTATRRTRFRSECPAVGDSSEMANVRATDVKPAEQEPPR